MITLGSDPVADLVTWPECDVPRRWLCLRLAQGAFTLERGTEVAGGDQPSAPLAECTYGSWIDIERFRLRVTNVEHRETQTEGTVPNRNAHTSRDPSDAPSSVTGLQIAWAEPEVEITTVDGGQLKFTFPGEGCEIVIGRKPKGTDFVIAEDRHISARHLRLFRSGGRPAIEDLHSTHGTTLNGMLLAEPAMLTNGDEIQFGQATMRYVCYRDVLRPEEAEGERSPSVSVPDPGGSGLDPPSKQVEVEDGAVGAEALLPNEPDRPLEPVAQQQGETAPTSRRARHRKRLRIDLAGPAGTLLILIVVSAFVFFVYQVFFAK